MDDTQAVEDVARLADGDADALQRLLVHCHAPLWNAVAAAANEVARQRVGVEDVLQEAYVAAFRHAFTTRFDNPGHFYKWLEQIALNQLRDVQRALKRQKRDVGREVQRPGAASDSYPDLLQRLTAGDPTPSRQLAREEALGAVLTSLARLPDEQRLVIQRRFIEGVAFEAIAAELGKSRDAVYMICHRGLKGLRGFMVSMTRHLVRV